MLSKIHSYCFFGDFVHWVMWILRTNVKMEMRLSQIQEVYRVVISKYIGEAYCRYQPYNDHTTRESILFSFALDQED